MLIDNLSQGNTMLAIQLRQKEQTWRHSVCRKIAKSRSVIIHIFLPTFLKNQQDKAYQDVSSA